MKKQKTDIYFSGDDSHAFLPWVIGIMACMATLLLCLGVSVSGWIVDRSGNYSHSFTVNIPAAADDANSKMMNAKNMLETLPGVTKVAQIGEDKLRDMLSAWLGSGDAVNALPLPIVLEVTTKENAVFDFSDIQARLDEIVPGTEIDAHERWVASFSDFSSALRTIMTILATLIVLGLALMIAFTSRASLKLHARTVGLLHSVGAEDDYIMRQFQHEAFMVTLRGAVPGCLTALAAYWLAGSYMASLQSSVLPSLTMRAPHAALLVLMPLACGFIAWTTARISVIKQLQRVL